MKLKKLYLFLTLLTAFLCLGSGTAWGETLTIAETPTTTSDCLPLYGYWGDTGGTKSQVIYSSDLLGDLAGGTITAMKFYASTSSASWTGTWAVSLAEVSNSSLSEIITPSSSTEVYRGTLSISSNEMTITFSEAFEYSGEKNLLVEISLTKTGNCPEANFRGISATGVGWCSKKYSAQNVLPKVTFTYTPGAPETCSKPTVLTKGTVTSTTASYSWTDDTNSQWQYLCLPSATTLTDDHWTGVEPTSNKTATVENLMPNKTKYKFYVRAYCSSSDQSKVLNDEFETECGIISIPAEGWTYGFESDETGSGKIPSCWTAKTYGTYTIYPYVYGSSARTGSKCLYFSGGSSSSPQSIILPEFNVDLKDLTLSFYYNNATTDTDYPSLTVGYYDTDGDYTTTFHQIGSALPVRNGYTLAEFDLKDVPTTYKHIVINYAGSGYYAHAAYVDDIKLIRTPNCVRPTEVAGANETATTAEISWTAGGSETKWKLQYTTVTPTSATDGDWTDANSGNDITDNPYTLEGLTPNKTAYYARVKAVCGGSDVSDWSDPSAAFYTECAAKAIPFAENFESTDANDIPSCWDNTNGTNSYTYENTAYITYAHNGNKCLRMYGGGSSSVQTVLLPELEEDVKNLTISLYYRNGSTGASYGKLQVGYVKEGTFTPLATVDQASTYTLYELDLKDADDDAEYIALRHATGSSDYGTLYIDDITVSLTPTCVKPSDLNIVSTMDVSAKLGWTANNSETAWKIEYSQNSDFSESTTVSANANPFTLTGLTASTTYYARVKADCGGGDLSAWCNNTVSFTTDCEATTVDATHIFTQNFNSLSAAGQIPTCWKNDKGTTTDAAKKWSYHNTGYDGACVRFNSFNNTNGLTNTLETPLIDLDVNSTLSFYAKNPTGGAYTLQISVDGATPVSLTTSPATLTGLTDWTEVTADLSSYTDHVVKILFNGVSNYANGDAYLYLDEVTVKKAPTCFKPATLNDAASITPEGATFTWTASSSNNEDYYQYICVAGGTDVNDIDWSASTKVAKAVAPATNQAVITGKATGTYDFYVRSWCSNDDQSEAVKKSFTTATVTAPTIGAITTTNESAHATWAAPDVSFGVQYQWKTSKEGSDWSDATSNLYADISDLDASTTYTFYVRSYYDASHIGSDVSTTFKTACDPFTVAVGTPFEQNFNDVTTNAIPDCWNNDGGTTTTDSYKWKVVTGGQSGKCAMFNGTDNGSGKTNVLATPLIELNSDADLSFYWKNKKTGAYAVEISVDGAARTTLVSGLTGIDAWTLVDKPLTSYNGHTIQLFFCGTSINDGSANLYLDELKITPISCRKPASDPVASAISDTEATLTWTAGGTNTDYQFALALKDEAPVWKAANVVSALTKSFDNLQPTTSYDFYVRTYCDALNQSEARKVSFRTECADFVTMPFEETFNSIAANAIPECWDNSEGTSSDTYKWKAVTYSGRNSSNCVRFNSSTNDADATNILATPTIQLGEGSLLSFYAKNPTGGAFKVQIKEEGEDAEDLIATGLTGLADWTLKYVDIPAAYNNKKVQILFHATSNAGDANAYIYIDDVRVLKHLSLSDAANNTTVLNNNNGKKVAVTIGRTIVRKGYYNTICLPFDVPTLTGTPFGIDGVELWAFKYAKVDEATDELLFRIDRSDHIEAGVPYFIGFPNDEDDIVNPFFNNVTISATVGQNIGDENVAQLCGIVDQPVAFAAGDQTKLFLAANNTLYWWNGASNSQMNAFRAYFKVKTSGSHMPIRRGMRARIVKEEQVATGVENVQGNNVQSTKLLENNQVIIIRNGVKYNLQGQVIK